MRLPRPDPALCALIGSLVIAGAAHAQRAAATEGALFLLLPTGAKSVSMGQAVSASSLGGEAIWWNPAGLAAAQRPEILLHHSQSIIGTGDALSFILPSQLLGVFAISAHTVNFGEQELGDGPGGVGGFLVPRSVVLAATYATPLTAWLRAGLSFKLVQMRADCSGACQDLESLTSSTSAVDFGVQIVPTASHPFSYALAVRNIGPRLQVVDTEQADALPSRLHVAVEYRVNAIERSLKETRLHLSAELVDRLRVSSPSFRFGSEIRYQERLFLRGGYILEDGGGASLGGGIVAGRLHIDFARTLGGLSADIGEPPTHISLRFRF